MWIKGEKKYDMNLKSEVNNMKNIYILNRNMSYDDVSSWKVKKYLGSIIVTWLTSPLSMTLFDQ